MVVEAYRASDGTMAWDLTWNRGYGYEEVGGLAIDGGSMFIAGWTKGNTTQDDLAVLKLDINGNLIWATTWGTPDWDEANGQIVVDSENVYVAGRYDAPSWITGGDALLAAFDKMTGAYKWHKTWGGPALDDALGMVVDLPSLYLVGMTKSFGQGMLIFLNKYNSNGDPV